MAELLPDHVQRQIRASRDTRAREHATVLDENPIGMHRRSGLDPREIVDVMMVGRALAPFEQAGLGGEQRAGADAKQRYCLVLIMSSASASP